MGSQPKNEKKRLTTQESLIECRYNKYRKNERMTMKVLGLGDSLNGGTIVSITRDGVTVDVKGKSVTFSLSQVELFVFGG